MAREKKSAPGEPVTRKRKRPYAMITQTIRRMNERREERELQKPPCLKPSHTSLPFPEGHFEGRENFYSYFPTEDEFKALLTKYQVTPEESQYFPLLGFEDGASVPYGHQDCCKKVVFKLVDDLVYGTVQYIRSNVTKSQLLPPDMRGEAGKEFFRDLVEKHGLEVFKLAGIDHLTEEELGFNKFELVKEVETA